MGGRSHPLVDPELRGGRSHPLVDPAGRDPGSVLVVCAAAAYRAICDLCLTYLKATLAHHGALLVTNAAGERSPVKPETSGDAAGVPG